MNETDFNNLYSEKLAPLAAQIPKAISGGEEQDGNFFMWSFTVAPFTAAVCAIFGVTGAIALFALLPGKRSPPIIQYGDRAFWPDVIVMCVGISVWYLTYKYLDKTFSAQFAALVARAHELRNQIMTETGNFFGLQFKHEPDFRAVDLKNAGLTEYFQATELRNVLYGGPGRCTLEICEAHIQTGVEGKHNTPVITDGLLAAYRLNKRFEGSTVIYEDSILNKMSSHGSKMERVKLEWADFEKAFDVYSSSQIDARVIMTPDFMEAVYNFNKQYSVKDLLISFYENKMLVFIQNSRWPYTKDVFSPPEYFRKFDFLIQMPQTLGAKFFSEDCLFEKQTQTPRQHAPAVIPAPAAAPAPKPVPPSDITPLANAIISNDVNKTLVLLSDGYDVNCKIPPKGDTPLHLAIWNGYDGMASALLAQKNIDVNITNNDGKTALDLAYETNNQKFIDILKTGSY